MWSEVPWIVNFLPKWPTLLTSKLSKPDILDINTDVDYFWNVSLSIFLHFLRHCSALRFGQSTHSQVFYKKGIFKNLLH